MSNGVDIFLFDPLVVFVGVVPVFVRGEDWKMKRWIKVLWLLRGVGVLVVFFPLWWRGSR